MTPFEMKDPLVAEPETGNVRLIAELFALDEIEPGKAGVVYVDTWWFNSDAHPFHFVAGELTGDKPMWTIGETEIYPLSMLPADNPLHSEWAAWIKYRDEDPNGKKATRELAKEILLR